MNFPSLLKQYKMESSKILQADVLDIIFETKNKAYGAYELRKNYHKRARKAVMITVTFALVVATIPLIAGLLNPDASHILPKTPTQVTIRAIEPIAPAVPIAEVEPPRQIPETAVEQFVAPIIVEATNARDDEKLPSQEVLSNSNFGEKKMEGPEGGPTGLEPTSGPTGGGNPIIEIQPEENTFDATVIDELPEFPGGEEAMMNFLKKNLVYPKRAIEVGENGKVVLEFVVDKQGNISEIDFLKKAGYGFDDEAKRVMGLMPEWRPGKINGHPVKARYQIPIIFELED